MKSLIFSTLLIWSVCAIAFGQQAKEKSYTATNQTNKKMNTDKITNPIVKIAIDALQKGDGKAWAALFTADTGFYDDGNKRDLSAFNKSAIGHERFTSIDKVENNGTAIYGNFHSDQWGDFKTYFKFTINGEGKISKLEIGQANY